MRLFLANMLAVAAVLPMASPAMAFDPDTPVGGPVAEHFPITPVEQPDAAIRLAFFTAFGVKHIPDAEAIVTREVEGRNYIFTPAAVHLMGDSRAVLLSLGSAPDAGHSDGGINAVHYLKSSPRGWILEGEWLGLGSVGTVGNAATSWTFTGLLGKNPYLVTAGGGVWQGCMISTTGLTELTPERPLDRGSFTNAMSSGAGIGQEEAEYSGQIIAATKDRSFTVGYSGTKSLRQNYVLRGGAYQLVGKDQIPGC